MICKQLDMVTTVLHIHNDVNCLFFYFFFLYFNRKSLISRDVITVEFFKILFVNFVFVAACE